MYSKRPTGLLYENFLKQIAKKIERERVDMIRVLERKEKEICDLKEAVRAKEEEYRLDLELKFREIEQVKEQERAVLNIKYEQERKNIQMEIEKRDLQIKAIKEKLKAEEIEKNKYILKINELKEEIEILKNNEKRKIADKEFQLKNQKIEIVKLKGCLEAQKKHYEQKMKEFKNSVLASALDEFEKKIFENVRNLKDE